MTKERGQYLANYVANCVGCHTNRDDMTFVPVAPEFAGCGRPTFRRNE